MIMSDHSPTFSDSLGAPWQQVWDNEGALPGQRHYNGGALTGLHDLVEDKDLAARAVALVVNSTRKGIVPLCADVARLLKQKKMLETKVDRLRSENESLRSSRSLSLRTSQSTSPPLSDRGSYTTDKLQPERSRPCSRCSSHGSSIQTRSPRQKRMSAFSKHSGNSHPTSVEIHSSFEPPLVHSSPQENICDATNRKNSLPEIVSEPQGIITRVSPRCPQTSVKVQCNLDGPGSSKQEDRDSQFREALLQNTRLAEDLGAAKKEIEKLKEQLAVLQLKQKDEDETFYVEDETKCPKPDYSSERIRSVCNEKTIISLGHHIITKDDLTGYVRYMGHMNGKPDEVIVGIELDEPVGKHDGSQHGKRYFTCRKNHGIFMPLDDITSIIEERESPDLLGCQKAVKVLRRRQKPSERRQHRSERSSLPCNIKRAASNEV